MPWRARPARILLVPVLVLVTAGCGGGGALDGSEPTSTPSTTTSAAPTTPAPSSTAGPTSTQPSPGQPAESVTYVPWRPADPVVPEHYARVAQRDCDAGQSQGPADEFWDAVLAVCRTLTHGDPWPDLDEPPTPPETDNPHVQCLDAELSHMLAGALAWRDENDGAQPEVAYPETGSACYLTAYDAQQVAPADDDTLPGPDQVSIEVLADSTFDIATVSVDGIEIGEFEYFDFGDSPFEGTRRLLIHVPRPNMPVQLQIELALEQGGTAKGTITATVGVRPPEDEPGPGTAIPVTFPSPGGSGAAAGEDRS